MRQDLRNGIGGLDVAIVVPSVVELDGSPAIFAVEMEDGVHLLAGKTEMVAKECSGIGLWSDPMGF